jgi:hypothetical protein
MNAAADAVPLFMSTRQPVSPPDGLDVLSARRARADRSARARKR